MIIEDDKRLAIVVYRIEQAKSFNAIDKFINLGK